VSFWLSVVGTFTTILGGVWAIAANYHDWRRRELGTYPPVAQLQQLAAPFRRARSNGTLNARLAMLEAHIDGRAHGYVQRTVDPDSPIEAQLDVRIRNLEDWRDDLELSLGELRDRIGAESAARSQLEQDVGGLRGEMQAQAHQDRAHTERALAGEFWGIVVAILGAALSGAAGLVPN
jgi:hypothetical protein